MKAKRLWRALCLSVLAVQLWAQAPASGTVQQQTDGQSTAQPIGSDEIKQLRDRIAKQEEEIKKLEQSVEEQRTMLEQAIKSNTAPAPTTATANPAPATAAGPELMGKAVSADVVPVVNNVARVSRRGPQIRETTAPPSPLSISIGNTTFTPLGFADATFFLRSTNVGSGIGTNFAGIPFNSAAGGKLSETNFTAQNSRIGMRIDSNFLGWKVLGYLEADFLFNNNANSFQISSNSAGFRLRNYFADVQKGGFEVLGGQDWSMLTPNRKGISPIPGDIFYTQDMDTNYQIGLVWTRAPQFRFIAHPNENVAFGVALENPQQYIGGGNGSGAVALPSGLSSIIGQFQYSPGLNVANSITNVPNLFPDIQAKLAIDGTPGGRAMHFEVAGVVRGFKDYLLPGVGGSAGVAGSHTAVGGGGEINSNLEVFKNFRLIENVFFSDGGGRYIFGSAPDFVVRPSGAISPLRADSTVDGFEAQVTPNTLLAMYYGGLYIGKDVVIDANGKTPVGYGYATSAGTQNRYVQELTFDWVQTLWKNKNYGALSLINQYSYVFREPWYVAPGTAAAGGPRQAHTNMIWVDLRYTLP
ncbi:MAG: hypothetical protein JO061_03065 [Acidobacteriaceae bacterium]|nr:hypothetical protein [Acidobacteriaceae bacterium]